MGPNRSCILQFRPIGRSKVLYASSLVLRCESQIPAKETSTSLSCLNLDEIISELCSPQIQVLSDG